MKEKIINIIRSVPISDKTYEAYVEAVADRLISKDYRKASEVALKVINAVESCIEYIEQQLEDVPDCFIALKRDINVIKKENTESERWEANLLMLKSGALGDDTSPKTLLRYWQMQESAGYPNASENVKYFEDIVRRESEGDNGN